MAVTVLAHRHRRKGRGSRPPALLAVGRRARRPLARATRRCCSGSRRFPSWQSASGGPPTRGSQLHSHAVLPLARPQPGVLGVSHRAHGDSSEPVACPASPASRGAARAAARWTRVMTSSRPVAALWIALGIAAPEFFATVYSRDTRSGWPCVSCRAIRARPRDDESLRLALQLVLLQRRVSRRASLAPGRALDAAAAASARRGADQPMAAGAALARRGQSGLARARPAAVCRGCSGSCSRHTSAHSGRCSRACRPSAA